MTGLDAYRIVRRHLPWATDKEAAGILIEHTCWPFDDGNLADTLDRQVFLYVSAQRHGLTTCYGCGMPAIESPCAECASGMAAATLPKPEAEGCDCAEKYGEPGVRFEDGHVFDCPELER